MGKNQLDRIMLKELSTPIFTVSYADRFDEEKLVSKRVTEMAQSCSCSCVDSGEVRAEFQSPKF